MVKAVAGCSFPFFQLKLTREAARMKEFDVTITETLKLTVSVGLLPKRKHSRW